MNHAARSVVLDEKNRVLLIFTTKKGRDRWELPGGKIGDDETPQHAADRELFEETGLRAIESIPLFESAGHFLDGQDWINHFYWTTDYTGTASVVEKDKASDLQWFDIDQILGLRTIPILSLIPAQAALQRINGIVQYRWPMTVPADQRDDTFVQGMFDRMAQGYWTYGHMRRRHDRPDNIKNILTRLVKYVGIERVERALPEIERYPGDGNLEWLMDEANFTMMEFAVPSHPQAHYRATSDAESPGSHVAGRVVHGKHELRGPHNVRQPKEGD